MKPSCRPVAMAWYKAFLKNKKRSGTSLPASFSAWFLKENISLVTFYQQTKFHFFVAFNSWDIKACVRCFLSNFFSPPNDSPYKTVKSFLFHQKSSFCSRDIQNFCSFFPFHTFQIQKDKRKWNNLGCHKLASINLQM